jgi:hypothetical protein
MKIKRYLIAGSTLLALALALGSAGPASATVPHTPFGLGIGDDDAIGSATMPPVSINNAYFDRLDPKIFRFQIYWDAGKAGNEVYLTRAKEEIKRVREDHLHSDGGVVNVLATFKRHVINGVAAKPSNAEYKAEITKVVQALASGVDVWGPANEVNGGEAWLPEGSGAIKAAEYSKSLAQVVAAYDPTALRTSPDFHDRKDLGTISSYITAFKNAGGDWGNAAAFHPYHGIGQKSNNTVEDIENLAPAGMPVWITEVGAYGIGAGYTGTQAQQAESLGWLLNGQAGNPGVGNLPEVARIYYYHMQGKASGATWDTALLNQDLTPRPVWYTYCAAVHGDNSGHADCAYPPPPPDVTIPPSAGYYDNLNNQFVFYRNAANGISQLFWNSTTWLWSSNAIGGSATGEPVGYTYAGKHWVYFRGTDGAIWSWYHDGTNWNLGRLGGSAAGDPMAFQRDGDRHFVYFRGTDGAIWQWQWDPGAVQWILTRLGGAAAGDPSALTRSSLDWVYFRGTDNAIWQYYHDGTKWNLTRLGGEATGTPDVFYRDGGRHFVYFRGTDGAIWQWQWDPGAVQWFLTRLGGSAVGDPAAVHWGSLDSIYFRGTDGAIWVEAHDGTQWNLTRLGGSAAGDPIAYIQPNGVHDVYFKGTDGAMWQWQREIGGAWVLTRLGN